MATARRLFLIGPGFIGGEILDILLNEGYGVTTLVRRESAATEFGKLGVEIVMGSLDDKDIITQQASQSDVVIHTATADHLPSVEAVIDGIAQRANNGKSTIFIHTSGASLLADDSEGSYKSDKIFSDDRPEDIDALPDTAAHREIDLAIVRAKQWLGAKAKLAIMIPPLIYGVSSRNQRLSIQSPTLVRFALKHGYAAHIGKGLSVWSQVHVADLARGYVVLLHWLEQSTPESVVQNPYFFCENGQELSWGEWAAEIGKALHQAGRIQDPVPRTVPSELYSDLFGVYSPWVVGSNSRNRANRLRRIGWEPREKSTFESLHTDEMPILLREKLSFGGYSKIAASGAATKGDTAKE